MAKTLEETQAAFVELQGAINDQLTSTVALITAVNKLIDAGTKAPPEDLQTLFDAIVAAKDTLVGDNSAVQAALDKANAPAA